MSTKRANAIDGQVAERVRALRKLLGFSQMQVAERLGISFQQVQKYEKGTNRIGAGRLLELARLFKVPVQSFYPEADVPTESVPELTEKLKAISDLAASAEGWRLFHSFSRVNDPYKRKMIIALIQQLAGPD
jgi:transcriptional regulator with XRE-family HTH domain